MPSITYGSKIVTGNHWKIQNAVNGLSGCGVPISIQDMCGRPVLSIPVAGEANDDLPKDRHHDAKCADCGKPARNLIIEIEGEMIDKSHRDTEDSHLGRRWFHCGMCAVG
jgi:hypothetical protein